MDPRPAAASHDPIASLTAAIDRASLASQWDVVTMLGRQLEALTRGPNVVDLAARRKR